jgi:thioredoxin-related protein
MADMTSAPQKKSTLDTVANIAIIVVCVIAAVVLIRNQFFPPQARVPGAQAQVEKGERFDQLKAVMPAGSNRALVVAVSPTCHFCNDSMPFYKKLIDQRNQQGSQVKVIAAVPNEEAKAEESQKFASAGASPDGMVHMDFSTIKVPGTPTLLLVDNDGKVLNVWVGKQDKKGEKEILEVL